MHLEIKDATKVNVNTAINFKFSNSVIFSIFNFHIYASVSVILFISCNKQTWLLKIPLDKDKSIS